MSKMTGHHSVTLAEFCRMFKNKELILPAWQRGLVWDIKKIENWHAMLDNVETHLKENKLSSLDIPGVVIFHTIKNETDNCAQRYINDGGNRLLATMRYIEILKSRNLTDDEICSKLSKVRIHYQEFEYNTEQDAHNWFVEMNKGTMPTPYELGRGVFAVRLSSFDNLWAPLIDQVHVIINDGLARMGCHRRDNRIDRHKGYRDDFAILYRFLKKMKTSTNLRAGAVSIPLKEMVERKLVDELNSIGFERFEKVDLPNFKKFIESEISLIHRLWKESGIELCPHDSFVRWLLHLGCYRKYNNVEIENIYLPWLLKLISRSSGRTTVMPLDAFKTLKSHKNLGLSNLNVIRGVCDLLGDDSILVLPKRKSTNRKSVPLGCHISHVHPFSTHGENETIIEPALLNQSRGKSPII